MTEHANRVEIASRCFTVAMILAFFGPTTSLDAQSTPAANGEPATTDAEPALPALREELLARLIKDQDARFKLIEWQKESGLVMGSPEFFEEAAPLIEDGQKVDEENREWFQGIVDKHGWPGKTLVGRDGAGAAFILAQHADRDRPFQKRCLELMQQAPAGEVGPQNLALLTDRVLLADGKPQRYGSQVEFVDGQWQPRPVEDPADLDERRKSVGLPPMEEYLRAIAEVYGKQQEAEKPLAAASESE